jgi:hypothetical protein
VGDYVVVDLAGAEHELRDVLARARERRVVDHDVEAAARELVHV